MYGIDSFVYSVSLVLVEPMVTARLLQVINYKSSCATCLFCLLSNTQRVVYVISSMIYAALFVLQP